MRITTRWMALMVILSALTITPATGFAQIEFLGFPVITGAQVDYNDIPSVYIDRPRLKDIFSILLDNALYYRHPKLTLHIRIYGELKAGRVIYRVADNGVGIPAECRERVFGVFERLQVHDDQNSTGIGLAIVRRIIESCGGSVSLQETPGGGTTVLFDLPG